MKTYYIKYEINGKKYTHVKTAKTRADAEAHLMDCSKKAKITEEVSDK
jgi:hypothetical protein